MPTQAQKALIYIAKHSVARPKDLAKLGITRATILRLCRQGILQHQGRGLYGKIGADISERHTLIEAQKIVPHGVICLLSALQFHSMTTQIPFEVWIGIGNKRRQSKASYPKLRFVYFSDLNSGIARHKIEGVVVKITTPARTVADCFKYRNKIGLDVAIEALRDYQRQRLGSVDELQKAARVARITNVIRPYLETVYNG